MAVPSTDFFAALARIFNSDQARAVILCGNVYDLFFNGSQYVPLIPLLSEKAKTQGVIRVIYELNGPVRILDDREKLKNAWIKWKTGQDVDTLLLKDLRKAGPSEADRRSAEFEQLLLDAIGNPTLALELLRQLTICSRTGGLEHDLLILIEAADMLLPAGDGDISSLNDKQLHRISIVQDWFGDPAFLAGRDSVCLIAESRSLIHPRVSRLPQVLPLEIAAPDTAARLHYIQFFSSTTARPPKLWGTAEELAAYTAGLSIHAIRQLLVAAAYADQTLTPGDLVAKVEEFIQGQLGEDVIEFKKPSHTLADVVGFSKLKRFLREELMPRFRASADKALTGAAVAGAIGGGKTFIFEAMAAELGLPVLVLKNIRSQWYGQTDVIFERLRRLLESLDKVVIFVDEADTQFGGVGREEHSTERRLTGKIQAMMSDPRLRGRVVWLLMTARIHLLSPDIRRPGRVGDLIIPVLDPEGDDRREFLRWVAKAAIKDPTEEQIARLDELTEGYSAAAFASLRQHLKAVEPETFDDVAAVVQDQIPPAIGLTRRYQTLQALVNCTRRSLLPDPTITEQDREAWQLELRQLEARGIA
ncbi:MAG: ATP-binding protein [Thermoguttaceae bacterium]|nr:ATP-binding protein [Thermoguttaceae bacterium]